MAYETGSTTSYADFITKLRAFLGANGWTTANAGNDSTGGNAFVASRGACFVYFGPYSFTESNYYVTSTRETRTIWGYRMGLGTALGTPASILNPSQMVGGIAQSITMQMGITEGATTAYHFFTDASGNFACAFEVLGDRYHHFGFGELDKRGMTHAGAAFCTAQWNFEYHSYSGARSEGNNPLMRPGYGGGRWNRSNSGAGGGWTQVRSVNAAPSGRGYPEGDVIIGPDDIAAVYNSTYPSDEGGVVMTGQGYSDLLTQLIRTPVLPVGNATPMSSVPIFVRSTGGRMIYLGDIPMFRRLRIDHLNPGDEIAIAGEVWKTFPVFRKTSPALIDAPLTLTSGGHGVAFRKVV